ncbi:hypothetical protein DVH24_029705 [Malus domestica]|uniref:F-box domain-containing protein n=1 Tax=Malus domestica TaxID=3750 RepID=A0A498HXW2_MALDO|nr:hypothetical protein DVH24_029705 [Malus domestica]
MGKVSPKESYSKNPKQKKRRGSGNKYLKPGALAQLKYNKVSSAKSCTDLGWKRVAVFESKKVEGDMVIEDKAIDKSPLMLSPVNLVRQNSLLKTPKTPRVEACESESRLESLPMDLLVVIARQFYFNYTTPDRSRQEMLNTMTPHPAEHWPFLNKGDGKGTWIRSPHTPKAPKHGPRPPSRLKVSEMRQVAAVLFQESNFHSRCMMPSALPKPLCKNRVLFYEDELCQAVAQNKLL